MAEAAKVKWFLEADFLQACNCDYGCPCEFSAPPTLGFCEGLVAYRINHGRYGDLALDDLGLALALHWPKAIHEGNGTAIIFFDERASLAQREALLNIVSGKAAGLPFEILVTTFTKIVGPRFVPFEFVFNGRNSSFKAVYRKKSKLSKLILSMSQLSWKLGLTFLMKGSSLLAWKRSYPFFHTPASRCSG